MIIFKELQEAKDIKVEFAPPPAAIFFCARKQKHDRTGISKLQHKIGSTEKNSETLTVCDDAYPSFESSCTKQETHMALQISDKDIVFVVAF